MNVVNYLSGCRQLICIRARGALGVALIGIHLTRPEPAENAGEERWVQILRALAVARSTSQYARSATSWPSSLAL
jgi:hypothetical protein